ncbi:MAG: M1 family metallopeptidase [Ferruginibacter sp.]
MKQLLLLFISINIFLSSPAQKSSYWQQQVNYDIEVSLNDRDNSLDGFIKMDYQNNSPDSLSFIWIHCWPNAYKNDRTAFSEQQLENGSTAFYFAPDEKRGYINRLNFTVNGIVVATADHPLHQDIIRLLLPAPLAPGKSVHIETAFHVKLPYQFSRGGYVNKSYQVTQWYPKPAVYDSRGWHPMPYLDQGEFYSEFGNYKVKIRVPKDYIVAATGSEVSKENKDSVQEKIFVQDHVHDFAWFADKDFMIAEDTLQLASKVIKVSAYYREKNKAWWKNSIAFTKAAILSKSKWLGEYPYNTVTVVENPLSGNGGMEYPTITLISASPDEKTMDYLINHEVGHNWFYGIIGSNERLHPWMDEGMNSYYDRKYFMERYGSVSLDFLGTKEKFLKDRMPADAEKLALDAVTTIRQDQPIETTSEDFNSVNYNLIPYTKTALWMKLLEAEMGTSTFDEFMHSYYEQWKFRHPYPEDFKNLADSFSGKNLDHVFNLQHTKGSIEPAAKKDIRIQSFFSLKDTDKHNYIFIAPALGYNFYDGPMVGLMLHNYTLPPQKLQFILSPLFATGSKQLNGMGRASLNFYNSNTRKLEIGVSGASFSGDSYKDSTGKNNYLRFSKLVPFVKYIFPKRNARSSVSSFVQWKTFLVSETNLLFSYDTTLQQYNITYPVGKRFVNQLNFTIENARVLYPWKGSFVAEQGKSFVRLNFTGDYFFNYPAKGGLNVRLYAGKFIYTVDKTFTTQFETDRYHLNMTGAKGYEDYTYSNYFIGRNGFEKFYSQQIMIKDGGFKVRTDLLSNKVGRTDDWLAAVNFTTTIPSSVNPFELTPLKLPIKAFLDIGSNAEGWKKNASSGRFLYDAGLQLSLFKNVINIYVPLLYSKVYKDYFKSTITEKRFVKNISFSIDIQNLSLKNLVPQFQF